MTIKFRIKRKINCSLRTKSMYILRQFFIFKKIKNRTSSWARTYKSVNYVLVLLYQVKVVWSKLDTSTIITNPLKLKILSSNHKDSSKAIIPDLACTCDKNNNNERTLVNNPRTSVALFSFPLIKLNI